MHPKENIEVTVEMAEFIFILHALQKKSKSGKQRQNKKLI
jgi:hypothetical protein